MQKIAISTHYGGFGFDQDLLDRLEELKGEQVDPYDYRDGSNRDDPDLIRAIEESNRPPKIGPADVAVVGIPDNVDWRIEEMDGAEWVAEKHRTWFPVPIENKNPGFPTIPSLTKGHSQVPPGHEIRRILTVCSYGSFWLSDESVRELAQLKGVPEEEISPSLHPRDDPDLIQVVEKIGPAAGLDKDYFNLGITEIPAYIGWTVENYDGAEWVAEKHRKWFYPHLDSRKRLSETGKETYDEYWKNRSEGYRQIVVCADSVKGLSLPEQETKRLAELKGVDQESINFDKIERDDPELVQLVTEMLKEPRYRYDDEGYCGELRIVLLPPDVTWTLEAENECRECVVTDGGIYRAYQSPYYYTGIFEPPEYICGRGF